jgi:hypothetical protein
MLVCNWLHYVGQNDFFVMMLLNRDSAIQSASRRFCTVYKSEKSDPLQLSGRRDIPFRCPTVQSIILPNNENFPSRPSSVSRSFELFQLASVLTFQQHFRMTLSVRQAKDFFPKHRYGKITATVRTMWIPVRTRSSIRQVLHLINRPDNHSLGPDAQSLNMETTCS